MANEITFTAIEEATNGTVVGTTLADEFTLVGTKQVEANDITFGNVTGVAGGDGNDERCITYEVPKELMHSGFGITIPLQAYYGIRFSYIGFGISSYLPLRVSLGDIDMETISLMIGLKVSVFI